MLNSYEDAFLWYSENAHRIDRFEFVEEDGTRRPLTNTEMYWLTKIKQAEDDGVDVPTDPQAQLEIACLKRERDEARERNAHISRQLVEADDAMERQRTELTRLRGLLRARASAFLILRTVELKLDQESRSSSRGKAMNIIERLIAWLEWNKRPCEERDLLNDALEELEAKEQRLAAAEAVLLNVMVHTVHLPEADRELLIGLLASIKRIVEASQRVAEDDSYTLRELLVYVLERLDWFNQPVLNDLATRIRNTLEARVFVKENDTRNRIGKDEAANGGQMSELPEVIDYLGTQWVRMDVVRKQEARLAAAEAANWRVFVPTPTTDEPTRMLEMEVIAIDHREHAITVSAHVCEAAKGGR